MPGLPSENGLEGPSNDQNMSSVNLLNLPGTTCIRFPSGASTPLNQAGMKIHPARFPTALPEFFIKLLTDGGDIVVDPFSGSNTCGSAAQQLGRKWIAMELLPEYLEASKFRFGD